MQSSNNGTWTGHYSRKVCAVIHNSNPCHYSSLPGSISPLIKHVIPLRGDGCQNHPRSASRAISILSQSTQRGSTFAGIVPKRQRLYYSTRISGSRYSPAQSNPRSHSKSRTRNRGPTTTHRIGTDRTDRSAVLCLSVLLTLIRDTRAAKSKFDDGPMTGLLKFRRSRDKVTCSGATNGCCSQELTGLYKQRVCPSSPSSEEDFQVRRTYIIADSTATFQRRDENRITDEISWPGVAVAARGVLAQGQLSWLRLLFFRRRSTHEWMAVECAVHKPPNDASLRPAMPQPCLA